MYYLIMNQVMLEQASTLPGMTLEKLKDFDSYLSAESRSETTPEQRGAYREISKALRNRPKTNLAITETRRDLMKAIFEPKGNARLYGLPLRYRDGINPSTYFPNDNPGDMWAITEYDNPERPINLKVNEGVGLILSGRERFKLYGTFKNHDDPESVRAYARKGGYPIERLNAPDTQMSADLPLDAEWIPAFLFVGNRLPKLCKDALVYVGQRYLDEPTDFGKLLKHRAGFFAISNLRNDTNTGGLRTVKKLDREIARLEGIVARNAGQQR